MQKGCKKLKMSFLHPFSVYPDLMKNGAEKRILFGAVLYGVTLYVFCAGQSKNTGLPVSAEV